MAVASHEHSLLLTRRPLSFSDAFTRAAAEVKKSRASELKWDTAFWKRVFEFRYCREPKDDSDVLWDTLFKEGFPAFRNHFENQAAEETAG